MEWPMVTSLKAAPNAARGRSIGTMLILYYQNISFPSKGADAAFAASVAPDRIVQFAQPAVDLHKTAVVSDQCILFRVGQEAQAADEGGFIVVVEVVVVRQIKVRFIYLVPQVGVLFAPVFRGFLCCIIKLDAYQSVLVLPLDFFCNLCYTLYKLIPFCNFQALNISPQDLQCVFTISIVYL